MIDQISHQRDFSKKNLKNGEGYIIWESTGQDWQSA